MSLARSIVGDRPEGRPETDFYPTPEWVTEALMERETFDGTIWEPACGDGAMSRVLERTHGVYSTDIKNYGFERQEMCRDFLAAPGAFKYRNVITNPPFSLAKEFAYKALEVTTGKVALLAKVAFLAGKARAEMFESTPIKKVYVFATRPKFGRNGLFYKNGGMIDFAWFVWEHGYKGEPTLSWIQK